MNDTFPATIQARIYDSAIKRVTRTFASTLGDVCRIFPSTSGPRRSVPSA